MRTFASAHVPAYSTGKRENSERALGLVLFDEPLHTKLVSENFDV